MERSYILVTNGSCRGFRCWRSFKKKKEKKNAWTKKKSPWDGGGWFLSDWSERHALLNLQTPRFFFPLGSDLRVVGMGEKIHL